MPQHTLSIIIPCYNEVAVIDRTLDAVEALGRRLWTEGIAIQVVVVDDASEDGTWDRLATRATAGAIVTARHVRNRGKGAAIQTGREHVDGDIVVIQDADLEYDPSDIPALIAPILGGRADAVVGSRFIGSRVHRVLYFWHRIGNGVLTLLSNACTNLNLTDMEAGYKAFSRAAFASMHLTNDRFGIEPEIVARLAQMGARVYEVPISYHGRTYAEGKKITWRDGIVAVLHIVRAWSSARRQPQLAPARIAPRAHSETVLDPGARGPVSQPP
ncbi:MAG: glycosyltransferase family 2 protein [Gemmatimonadales bacterium]|nr:glycosyltransferase family 2 protein [Gemmatimonadales bacterium]